MAEHAIAWEPIPRDANHFMLVSVMHFAERTSQEGMPVSVVVTATAGRAAQEEGGRAAWRIEFGAVAAFQRRPLNAWWPGSRPITIPRGRGASSERLEVAAWEIVQSAWLRECVPPDTYPGTMHHFVIADEDDAYEIAALVWTSERLSPGWEQDYGA